MTRKSFEASPCPASPDGQEMEKINRFTLNPLSPEEIFTFSVVLCDNETDRDNERFDTASLEELARLFEGKTGICDHSMKSSDQIARIYECHTETDPSRITEAGEKYCALRAKAYTLNIPANRDFISEIKGGIRKEVSVSCGISSVKCSICGTELREKSCSHRKGEIYSGKRCTHILSSPGDAYEWSFVAVPAQRCAGVTKAFDFRESEEFSSLEKRAALGDEYRKILIGEGVGFAALVLPALSREKAEKILDGIEPDALRSLHDALRERAREITPPASQLTGEKTTSASVDEFRI